MKSAIFAFCVATVALATPALSQGIYLGGGPFGPSVGIGVGPYIFIDHKHPVNSGQTVNVGLNTPAAIAPIVSLTVARQLSDHWIVRAVWHRVTTNYSRDSDIFLVGLGYRWR